MKGGFFTAAKTQIFLLLTAGYNAQNTETALESTCERTNTLERTGIHVADTVIRTEFPKNSKFCTEIFLIPALALKTRMNARLELSSVW